MPSIEDHTAEAQAVWDAWVEVSTETAKALGVVNGYVLRVTSPHGAIELPAYVSASLHPGVVAVPIGHRYAPYHVPRYVAPPPTSLNPVALLPAAPDAASGGLPYLDLQIADTSVIPQLATSLVMEGTAYDTGGTTAIYIHPHISGALDTAKLQTITTPVANVSSRKYIEIELYNRRFDILYDATGTATLTPVFLRCLGFEVATP